MWSYTYLIIALLVLFVTGFQELDIFAVLQNVTTRSSGAKLTKCKEAVNKMNLAKEWSRAMFDATSKLQSGILAGNSYELGAFDECLAIDDIVDEVKGKYCLGTIQIATSTKLSQVYGIHFKENTTGTEDAGAQTLSLRWSLCIPDACTANDINTMLQEFKLNFLSFKEADCQSIATQLSLNTGDYWAIAFFVIIGFIMLLSTLYDIYLYCQEKKTSHPSLLAFSVLTNGRKLFQVVDNPNNLQCVAGLRSISIMWVVLGHMVSSQMITSANLIDLVQWYLSPDSMYVAGAPVAVDTFFLLGGMVMVYVYLGTKGDFRYYNVPAYYLHRYLRLTPVLAVVVLINATLLENVGSGPLWTSPANIAPLDFCKEHWWSTLLYIQNYVNIDKMCVGVTWYLSLDMQLFILSPLILIPLKKYTKGTLTAVVLLTCASVASAVYTCWYYKLNSLNIMDYNPNWIPKYYSVIWTRAAPWLIGIILGYYVYQVKNVRSIKLNKLLVVTLWIASLTILCICVFCGNELVTTQKDNLVATTLYSSLVRPVWAIALSWVVYACVSGYGGPINAFLSLPVFQIIGRVSYSIYLIHNNILSSIVFTARVPIRFSNLSIMLNFWSYFMVSFFISVVFSLTFESPVIVLEKSIKSRGKHSTAQPLENVAKVPPEP